MKTKEQIQELITTTEKLVAKSRKQHNKKLEIRHTKNLEQFRLMLAYYSIIQPTESKLTLEKDKLQIIIKSKKSQYEQWKSNNTISNNEKKNRRTFNQELGLTQLRKQLRFINKILN